MAEQIARVLAQGGALPPWVVRFPNADARHAYARAYYRWINGDRSIVVHAALQHPDLSWLYEDAGAGAKPPVPSVRSQCTSRFTWENAPIGNQMGGSVRPHAPAPAGDREAASIMENVARLVAAAGGRRALSADDWADRCGIPAHTLSRLLTAEAARYGLAVRRYKAGHEGTRMIEVSREGG